MNKLFIALATLVILAGCKNEPTGGLFPGVKTDKHRNIAASHIYLAISDSFKAIPGTMGLQKNEQTAIVAYDMPGSSYYTNAEGFSKQAFEGRGGVVYTYLDTMVGSYKARYVYLQSEPGTNAVGLLFGDSSFTAMLMATYPQTDSLGGAEIKKAIYSTAYDKNLKVDPLANAVFTMPDGQSTFKYAKTVQGAYLYTLNGVEPKDMDAVVTLTTIPLNEEITAQKISELFTEQLKQYGLTDIKVASKADLTVNNAPAYESITEATVNGDKAQFYQLVIMGKEHAVAVQSMLTPLHTTLLPEVQKLGMGLKFK